MAIRYDQKTKDEVVAFIKKYNIENGRGGQSAAVKKFSINPITVRSWMEKAGVATPGKSAKKNRRSATSRKRNALPSSAPATKVETLQKMAAIQEEIGVLRTEYDTLKATL